MNREVEPGLGKEGVGECSVWDIRNLRASFIQVTFEQVVCARHSSASKKEITMASALMELVGLVGQADKGNYNPV